MSITPADQHSITMTASDEELRSALEVGNIPTLLLVMAQLSGDDSWLRDPYIPSRTAALDDNDSAGFSPAIQSSIRSAAFKLIRDWREGKFGTPAPPPDGKITTMLSASLSEEVPPEYGPSMAEEAGFHARPGVGWTRERPDAADTLDIIVIGAGLAGVATGATLLDLGLDFTMIEKSSAPGGVWQDNRYPGAGVDTPTHLYSYSFSPRRDWSRFYARQGEILTYIQKTADDLGVTPHIRFDTEVECATWSAADQRWHVTIRSGDVVTQIAAKVVISCVGVLNRPAIPAFAGMDEFTGPMFHSSRWDPGLNVTGKNVAVIGTGATSMQLVPALAGTAAKVTVIQRSPQWIVPNPNYLRDVPDGVRLLMNQVPFYASFYRLRLVWLFQDKLLPSLRRDPNWPHPERSINATNEKHREFLTSYIDRQLGDRTDLRGKVLPTYPPYGKRILMDNRWIETVKRDDVELIQAGVERFDATRVHTTDGGAHEVDVVVLATGFESSKMLSPMRIVGRSGVPLSTQWGDDNPYAYLGMTVPDFPNFFVVGGPNTALGHGGSAIYPAECCIGYIAQLLVRMVEDDLSTIEVRPEVSEEYNKRVDAEHAQLIWTHPGMTVWYKNKHGRVTASAPWRGVDFWSMTRKPNLEDFAITHHANIDTHA